MVFTEKQEKIFRAEAWNYGRAMQGGPADAELRGEDGYTLIDSEAYTNAMQERLQAVFGQKDSIKIACEALKRTRAFQAPELFAQEMGQIFFSLHQRLEND